MSHKETFGELFMESTSDISGRTKKPKQSWRWRIRAANNRVIATSGESFASKSNAMRALTNVVQTIGAVARQPTTVPNAVPLFTVVTLSEVGDGATDVRYVPCTA